MRVRNQLTCFAVTVIALLAAFPAAAQCDNGREGVLSDTFLGSTAVEWRMLVEHRAVTLTVSAPCGLVIDRTYEEGESPSFSLKEIPAANPDGVYTWQLRVAPHVDPEVEKMLMSARESGEDQTIEYELRQKGALPEGPFLQTGSFTVFKGGIVPPDEEEERQSSSKLTAGVRPAASADNCPYTQAEPAVQAARLGSIAPAVDRGGSTRSVAMAAETPRRMTEETVISGDLTVYNSLCVGFDCLSNETYGADTIRLKENNLRIHFDDTSTASSFPRNDWRIEVNSQNNGGGSYFRINDVTGARSPFTIEAGAPSHSLYVDSTGRIGRKTANPVLELHLVDGDTPGIRLEQDTSSGFGAQVWDIAGNETNFFVRDASSGSTLPFRIYPGSPSSSLVIRDGDVGVGINSPTASMHLRRSDGSAQVLVEEASGTVATRSLLTLTNNGGAGFALDNSNSGQEWRIDTGGADFNITLVGTGELAEIDTAGNLTIAGEIFTDGTCSIGCDLVFSPTYELESIEEHAASMWSNRHLPAVGPTPEQGTFNLTQKTLGVLNELEKAHIYIAQLHERLESKDSELATLAAATSELRSQQEILAETVRALQNRLDLTTASGIE